MEVLEEGREWTRRRLEQRLQEEANHQGGVFPPQRSKGPSSAKGADGSADGGWSGSGGGFLKCAVRRDRRIKKIVSPIWEEG